MNEQSWKNDKCDRKEWEPGPWDGEPDKVQWKDEATGLDCLANRHDRNGHWCGYVGVPPGHPLHGKDYDSVSIPGNEDGYPRVHGGLTYADECQERDEPCRGICHIAAPGEPDKLWWLGFDCAHCDDAAPRDYFYARTRGYPFKPVRGEYRTLDYVKAECASLAGQLARVTA